MNYRIFEGGREVRGEFSIELMKTEDAGIFESMRASRGKVLHEEDHLTRLLESAKTVGYKPVPERQKLRDELNRALRAFQGDSPFKAFRGTVPFMNLFVRLTLWEGRTFVILGMRGHSTTLYKEGVALKTASFVRGGPRTFPWQVKASAYQQAILASTEPHPDKIYEWIFLDEQGLLTETRVGNFFLVQYPCRDRASVKTETGSLRGKGAILLTPPEHGILNGVTRRFVIKCALALGFKVREVPLTRHEFFNADEAFLCNTSWEILPVRELDGRAIGAGKPGPVTIQLHRSFKRRIQHDVTPHRPPRAPKRLR